MNTKTISEEVFERFLRENSLIFEKIEEKDTPRPDYLVHAGGTRLMFEVKELVEDKDFGVVRDTSRPDIRTGVRTVGDHVRKKITVARKQIRYAAKLGIPAILLVYNNIDPIHLFGTENADFITAMYGEYTLLLDREAGRVTDAFYGRNQSLREDCNIEFSAVARLAPCGGTMIATLFENVFSTLKIPYESLPTCFEIVRVELSSQSPGLVARTVVEDSWSKNMGRGQMTFTTTAIGAKFNHEARFEEPYHVGTRSLQSTGPLTREEVENRFSDFIAEIMDAQRV
jgi:hypothetical protein